MNGFEATLTVQVQQDAVIDTVLTVGLAAAAIRVEDLRTAQRLS
jgi:hypothetical protein